MQLFLLPVARWEPFIKTSTHWNFSWNLHVQQVSVAQEQHSGFVFFEWAKTIHGQGVTVTHLFLIGLPMNIGR